MTEKPTCTRARKGLYTSPHGGARNGFGKERSDDALIESKVQPGERRNLEKSESKNLEGLGKVPQGGQEDWRRKKMIWRAQGVRGGVRMGKSKRGFS